jgi:hypothetical protein
MKKDSKERLFEVMGRLDKTFKPKETLNEEVKEVKPKLNEELEDVMDTEVSAEEPVEEKSPEEKLAEITTKVDELHAMLHGEEDSPAEEVPAEPEADEEGEVEIELGEGLDEHHLKDKASRIDFICKNDKEAKKEDLEKLSDEEVEKKYVALEKKMGLYEGDKKDMDGDGDIDSDDWKAKRDAAIKKSKGEELDENEEVPVAAVAKVGEAK